MLHAHSLTDTPKRRVGEPTEPLGGVSAPVWGRSVAEAQAANTQTLLSAALFFSVASYELSTQPDQPKEQRTVHQDGGWKS
jgi:hypothetical protein